MEKGQSLHQMVPGPLSSHMQKLECGPPSHTIYKINSKWTKDLNVSDKTLRKHKGNLHDLGIGMRFLEMAPKSRATKEKLDKSGFIKIENFCASKDTTKKVKRQSTGWDKILANHISDKGLVSRIYKGL